VLSRCWLQGRCDCTCPSGGSPPPDRASVFGLTVGPDISPGPKVEALIDALGVETATRSAVLKLNLCEYRDWQSGATTSPAVVRAIVAALRSRCPQLERIVLLECDSSGTRASDLFQLLGFADLAAEEGLDLFDTTTGAWVLVDHVGELPIEIPAVVRETDLYVNVPKMKLHGKALFTGALKNNFGLVRRKWKLPYHARLCETIIASNLHLPRQATIMDGTVVLSGRGPAYGVPSRPGVMLGSWDPVAIDAAGARLSGVPVAAAGHIRLARAAGIGNDEHRLDWLGSPAARTGRPRPDWLRLAMANALRRA
jgi:uncharacterized protein (DUF362 family)